MANPYRHIKEKTRCLLWAKAAGRCQFDAHNKILWRDKYTKREMNFAEVAHIIGVGEKGPRNRKGLSKEYLNSIDNLMLLCPDHHKLVDNNPEDYPQAVLRKMKKDHERRMQVLTEIVVDKTSNMILYGVNIGEHGSLINKRDASVAMVREGWYPTDAYPIELGLSKSDVKDHEEDFWENERQNLRRKFERKVVPIIEEGERNHFSIFALAPQPLLIEFGNLFSDIYPAEVYQLHREPPNWEWQTGPDGFDYIVQEPKSRHRNVALNLSLSATISDERIIKALGSEEASIWRITIDNPNNDFLKSREQLEKFRIQFRTLLDKIKAKHGEEGVTHIFPAVPVSVAVEIGRIRQPKADLPFVIYDQNRDRGGFAEAIRIG